MRVGARKKAINSDVRGLLQQRLLPGSGWQKVYWLLEEEPMLKSSEVGASFRIISSWFPISSSLGGSSVTISESSLVVAKYTLSSGEAASST